MRYSEITRVDERGYKIEEEEDDGQERRRKPEISLTTATNLLRRPYGIVSDSFTLHSVVLPIPNAVIKSGLT